MNEDLERRRHEEESSKADIVEFCSLIIGDNVPISVIAARLKSMLIAAHSRGVEQGRHLPSYPLRTDKRKQPFHAVDAVDHLVESAPVAVDSLDERDEWGQSSAG